MQGPAAQVGVTRGMPSENEADGRTECRIILDPAFDPGARDLHILKESALAERSARIACTA